jgi:hypothetical protein
VRGSDLQPTIDRRFRGPQGSGNGGYSCGLLGARLGPSAEVNLRLPPPLDTPLRVDAGRLLDGERVIADGRAVEVTVDDLPPAPTLEQARAASAAYVHDGSHFFPECFVCGPHREVGDGLRIFGTPVDGLPGLVALWEPQEAVSPEVLWAALDCMTGWCVLDGGPCVLARLAVRIDAPVGAGPKIIHAWPTGADGRKQYSSEALYEADGRLLAVASALWIRLRDPSAFQVQGI